MQYSASQAYMLTYVAVFLEHLLKSRTMNIIQNTTWKLQAKT